MSKRIRYSQPLYHIWQCYNKSNKNGNLSPKEFIWEWLGPQIHNPFFERGDFVQTNIFVSEMFYADTQKEFLHLYFVDKSLRDFLIQLPIRDFDGLMTTVLEIGEDVDGGCVNTFGQIASIGKNHKELNFGIHIPLESFDKGYAFSFIFQPETEKLVFAWHVGRNADYFPVDDYKRLLVDKTEAARINLELFQLAVNTVVYMNTFPECVIDGAPNNIKDEYSKKISIAEKVTDIINSDSSRTVLPHARRAYFKRLTSDYYTHKKGQTILVKATMVNGRAKTIYTAGNIETMTEFEE